MKKTFKTLQYTEPLFYKNKKFKLLTINCRTIILILQLFLLTNEVLSSTYYVSSNGNDNNSGRSPQDAWKTLEKVNLEFAGMKPGDSILFHRGDIFYGTLQIGSSGKDDKRIVISTYGQGTRPVISGFYIIRKWHKIREGLFSTVHPLVTPLNLVVVNDQNTPAGRWPNSGWMKIDTHNGKNSITDSALPSEPDWTGGEIVVRTRTWVLDKRKILIHKSKTLNFDPLYYEPVNGSGYYIQNHPETLDKPGEWSFNGQTFTIFIGPGETPEKHLIKIAVIRDLLKIENKSNITIENLQFEGANENGCFLIGSENITIRNCNFLFNGRNGVYAYGNCNHLLLDKNFFSDNNNSGIYLSNDSHNCIISGNEIHRSGYLQGMGDSTDDSYSGIVCQGDYSLITRNKVENSGYTGIRWGGQESEVSYNYITKTCLWKDDGGGIYTFSDESTGKIVKNNIVLNAKAHPDGWHYYEAERAHGIYIDGSDNILLTGNTIAYNEGAGMYINEARNIIAEENICFSNKYGIMVTSMTGDTFARNLLIQKNLLYAYSNDQYGFFYATKKGKDEVSQFGHSDKNHFLTTRTDNKSIMVWINAWNWAPGDKSFLTLKEWKQTYGKDLNSKEYPDTIIEENNIVAKQNQESSIRSARPFDSFSELDNYRFIFEYNNTCELKKIDLDGNYIDIYGNKYSKTFILQPFSSVILFRIKLGITNNKL